MSETRKDERVREAFVRLYRAAHISTDASACYEFKTLLGLHEYDDEYKFADALLARATPPAAETGEEAYNYLAEVVEGAAHEFSRQAMWDKTGRADFYCAHLKEAAGRLRGKLAAPAPREVSEAMVEAGYQWYIGAADVEDLPTKSIIRHILRAALSAETGTP